MPELDQLRLQLNSMKEQGDLAEQRLGLRLDRLEEKLQRRHITTGQAAIVATLLGLLGAVGGAYFEGESSVSVERMKFESALIADALEAESQEEAAGNLLFLVRARLIDGRDGAIEKLVDNPSALPIKTLESRLRELEVRSEYFRCLAVGGQLDPVTLTCRGAPPTEGSDDDRQ